MRKEKTSTRKKDKEINSLEAESEALDGRIAELEAELSAKKARVKAVMDKFLKLKPQRGISEYSVYVYEKELGCFDIVKGKKKEKIDGYLIWEGKAINRYFWTLPDSFQPMIVSLKRWVWNDNRDPVAFDGEDEENYGNVEMKGSSAFDSNGNPIKDYEGFNGEGDTSIVETGSLYGPSSICIEYNNDDKLTWICSEDSIVMRTDNDEIYMTKGEMIKFISKLS